QIFAHAAQVADDAYAMALQQLPRTDAGQLQYLRRPDGPRSKQGLMPGFGGPFLPVAEEFDAGAAHALLRSLEFKLLDLAARHDLDLAAPLFGTQEGTCRVQAYTTALIHFEVGTALVIAAVEIIDLGNAGLRRRFAEGIENFPRQPLPLDAPFATAAMHRIAAAVMVFALDETRQHFLPRPSQVARQIGPLVVVARLHPHVDHAVDRR